MAIPGGTHCRDCGLCGCLPSGGIHTLDLLLEEPALYLPLDGLPHRRPGEPHRLGRPIPGNLASDRASAARPDASCASESSETVRRADLNRGCETSAHMQDTWPCSRSCAAT